MKLMSTKKGNMNLGKPLTVTFGIIGLVVLIKVLVATLPELITALVNISTIANLPFADFFSAGGVGLLILGVSVFALVIYAVVKMLK